MWPSKTKEGGGSMKPRVWKLNHLRLYHVSVNVVLHIQNAVFVRRDLVQIDFDMPAKSVELIKTGLHEL